jgi:hypothetical protein
MKNALARFVVGIGLVYMFYVYIKTVFFEALHTLIHVNVVLGFSRIFLYLALGYVFYRVIQEWFKWDTRAFD